MLRTKLDKHIRYHCSAGTRYENIYEEEIEKKSGKKHLVKVGQTCVYDKIQADLEQSKIENIIHKLAMGDLSVLKQAQLTYADADDFPKTLMEAQNIVIKAKSEFNKFPEEVKKLFNDSPEQYVSEMGSDEFIKKMAPYNDSIAKHKKDEANEEFNRQVEAAAAFNKAVNEKMGGTEE